MTTFAAQGAIAIQNVQLFVSLQQRERELEVAGRHKSEFLASMSHELRTPLNAVIGFSDVLLERMFGELNDRQEEYVRDIRDSGRHLLELINEILDLSKVAGRGGWSRGRRALLPDLLEHGLAMVRERAARHRIAIALEVAPEVGVVRADELKLKQVVLNLLTNAVKFTPDGGSVDVTAEIAGDEALVTVRDTGVGIARRPSRSGSSRRSSVAAARRGRRNRARPDAVEADRRAARRPDLARERSGRRKHLRVRDPGPAGGRRAGRRAARGRGRRARHADRAGGRGRPALGRAAVRVSRGAGYRTVVAHDGVEGLELARRLRPRAVVLDILLPRVDGWDLLARLKADPPPPTRRWWWCRCSTSAARAWRWAPSSIWSSRWAARSCSRRSSAAPRRSVSATVLVIEDNPLNRKLVRDVLGHAGYRVLEAADAEQGIAAARAERPDLVLMDIQLPGIDGIEALGRLRADEATAAIPVAALTAQAMKDDRERFLAAGFDGYLEKPVSVPALPGQVEALIAGAR